MAIESPVAKQQFFDANGNPLVGGKLYIYKAGTTTPATTWTDKLQTAANANPIILDSRGECVIWLDTESAYKYVLKTALDVEVYSVDNVNGALAIDNLRTDLAADEGSSLIGYIAEGTGAVATTVQDKLRETVSVKDFGAVGDGVTDDTDAIQAAYDYVAIVGGIINWPTAVYKVDGTIYFSENTKTDLCKSTILGSGNITFATGYVLGGNVVANYGTVNNCDKASIENGTIINNGGIAFKLTNFRFYCYIKNIVCNDVAQIVVADTCYYSRYENLIYFGSADFVTGVANTTTSSTTIVVTNAIRSTLVNGMEIACHFAPTGTTINSIGAIDSAGSGYANVTISNAATKTGIAGGVNTGFIASLSPKALYDFSTANSDMYFRQCSAGSRFIGFKLNEVNSTTFDSCDIESCGYGFVFTGGSTNNVFNSLHTETVYGFVWNCAGNNGNGSMYVHGFNPFHVAGVIDAGDIGYVDGVLNFPKTMAGFTPYGFTDNGEPWINLSSSNAKPIIIGGGQDIFLSGTGESTVLYYGGLHLVNSPSNNDQTLDYYKENIWVPVLEGTTSIGIGTYTTQNGTYTRIGNRVFFSLTLAWTAHTGTGNMRISGWPFEPANVYRAFPAIASNITLSVGSQVAVQIGGTSFTKADIIQYNGSGSVAVIAMDTEGQIVINGSYEV